MRDVPNKDAAFYGIDFTWIAEHMLMPLFGYSANDVANFYADVVSLWKIIALIALVFSAVLLYFFVYARVRFSQLSALESEEIEKAEHEYAHIRAGSAKNPRWEEVTHHVESINPNDWRLAIIEADIMLEELLRDRGYSGSTIGEKLKGANPHTFKTLEDAWQAHKIRNEIAHRGSDFILTQRISQDAISRYRRVFAEFGII